MFALSFRTYTPGVVPDRSSTGPWRYKLLCCGFLLLAAAGAAGAAPPIPATGLKAHTASITQIDLSWTDNSDNETGFELQRRTYSGTWATIATLPVNATSYSDTGLAPLDTYIYRVRPFSAGGPAVYWSNEAWAAPALPPAAPTNLQGTAVSDGFELTWTDNSSDEHAFEIYRKITGSTDPFTRIGLTAPDASRFRDRSLATTSHVTYRVRATRDEGASAWSNEWSSSVPGTPPAPSGLTARAISSREIELRWTNNATNASAIRISRTVDGVWYGMATLPANTTSFRDTACRPGVTYYYVVTAVAGGISSLLSNEASTTPPPDP
jgi:hypothetical protein